MSGSAQPLENFSFEVNETQPGKSVLYYSRGETYRTLAPETLFKVYVGARDYDLPPVAGQYVVDREKIIFQPFYDWSEGQVYSAVNESGEVFQF